jgi:hypothetical protein
MQIQNFTKKMTLRFDGKVAVITGAGGGKHHLI